MFNFTLPFTANVNGNAVPFNVTQENVKEVWFADDFADFVQKGADNFAGMEKEHAATAFNAFMETVVSFPANNFVASTFNPFA